MLVSARLPLGAPGLYTLPERSAPRLSAQRMDVCAFVGVAPRGPAYVPLVDQSHADGAAMMREFERPRKRSVAVAVNSFDEYRRLYGTYEGPGFLPHAVASFFEQGGKRAYIVRIVHAQPPATPPLSAPDHLQKLALHRLDDLLAANRSLGFYARNEGSWGDGLQIELRFAARGLACRNEAGGLSLARNTQLCAGSLLRLWYAGADPELRWCRGLSQRRDADGPGSRWLIQFDAPLALTPERVEVIEASLMLRDAAGYRETHSQLGLTPAHPRYLADVLCNESELVWPHYDWAAAELLPASANCEALRGTAVLQTAGVDDYENIVIDDFFDTSWSAAEEQPGEGLCCLAQRSDLTQLLVPDLYLPAQWARQGSTAQADPASAGGVFAPCASVSEVVSTAAAPALLQKLVLDPRNSSELDEIIRRQQQIIDFCEQTQDLIALLDVPPGLSQQQAERWRARFDSAWAAAYHPWLLTPQGGSDTPRRIPPSATAAGLIARKELARGIAHGPANELAAEIVSFAESVPAQRAEVFHPLHLNCYRRECDGIYLLAARTLSQDPQWRQLSVRRLVLMLRRTLLQETQWAVFEPNGPKLWRDLQRAIENLLRQLFRLGAFAGATEAESFFVRLRHDTRNQDRGELIAEIGVAPAEPIEFILLSLRRSGDGTLSLEE